MRKSHFGCLEAPLTTGPEHIVQDQPIRVRPGMGEKNRSSGTMPSDRQNIPLGELRSDGLSDRSLLHTRRFLLQGVRHIDDSRASLLVSAAAALRTPPGGYEPKVWTAGGWVPVLQTVAGELPVLILDGGLCGERHADTILFRLSHRGAHFLIPLTDHPDWATWTH